MKESLVLLKNYQSFKKWNLQANEFSIKKNVSINKLGNIVNEYNNTYHITIKMKPVDVKDNTYIDSIKEVNDKDFKFKVDDHLRISKYKNIFDKGYTLWLKE